MRATWLTAVVVVVGAASVAHAETITGTVTSAPGRWTADGSRIVTDAVVHTEAGDVTVSQLGGTANGLTMRTFPGAAPLVAGMQVTIAAHRDYDLARELHLVVDDVHVIADAPPDYARYVRSGPTKAGHYLYWESGCIFVTYDAAGTVALPGDTEFPLIDASIETWNSDTTSCSYMKVMSLGTKSGLEVGNDGINLIKFRDSSWCRPAVDDDPMRCYAAASAGLTTATYVDDTSSRDGAIVDADIEINGVNFAISNNGQTLSTQTCLAELQNTMTHEVGHLHGLEHTCLAPTDPQRVDGNGNPVPDCSATTDPTILDATMYPFQNCGETIKETLTADDIAGICAIYPSAKAPGTCAQVTAPSSGGGCVADDDGASGAMALSGLGLLVFAVRRRT